MSDAEVGPDGLVTGVVAGDRAAEEEFARRFGRRVYLLLLVHTRDPARSRALAERTLRDSLRAVRERRITDEGALPELVLTIAQQLVAHHRRIAARRCDDGPGAPPLRDVLTDGDRPGSDRRARARRILRTMGVEERRILRWRLVESWSDRKIGRRLHLREEAVRACLSRAAERLDSEAGAPPSHPPAA